MTTPRRLLPSALFLVLAGSPAAFSQPPDGHTPEAVVSGDPVADVEKLRALLANREEEVEQLREQTRELMQRLEREDLRGKAIRRARDDDKKRSQEESEKLRADLEKQKAERVAETERHEKQIRELRDKVEKLTPDAAALPAVRKEKERLAGSVDTLSVERDDARKKAAAAELAKEKAEAEFERLRAKAGAADQARQQAVREKVEAVTAVEAVRARLSATEDADSEAVKRARELSDELARLRADYERLQVEADEFRSRLDASESRAERNRERADQASREAALLDAKNEELRRRFCNGGTDCPP